jgi:hypothetical protein
MGLVGTVAVGTVLAGTVLIVTEHRGHDVSIR